MPKIKIGVIGLGSIAQLVHLPNLTKLDNAEVVAVSEIKKNRLNTIADKFGISQRFPDYKEMLENAEIDAVIIATPTNTHKEIAIDCLNADKDVLVEKPLARTFSEAKAVVDVARKNKKKLMVGMNLRYRPDTMLLRSIVSSGEIGEPFYAKCGWVRRQSSEEKWFTKKEEAGGGVIIDLGIHLLDLALWLMNYPEINSVSCKTFQHNTKNVEDTAISFIKFKNDSLINLEVSWSMPTDKDHFFLSVFGTKGSFTLSPLHVYKRINDEILDLTPAQVDNSTTLFKKSYMNELKSFVGAVKGLNPVLSPGDEALERMKIIEAMYQSANKDQEIKL
ncbi:Putative dehydrogenase [Ignavibacterium album JCM 16511]|uniref:Putative dehydrogenase n=1 Tax=Ignavibacterium album (strain DSM 19864 / JCM 16511 / NBRC 101810 / Mat9-16) TaxID=945713 RepID=I0ALI1_IGNAJ|nr:Gfo/Idh/MocA family oxidoreductase [Ignavibacterium album]AFH49838.1 Putative dehydrogenase [Ignavibacterium album JCM 16511]